MYQDLHYFSFLCRECVVIFSNVLFLYCVRLVLVLVVNIEYHQESTSCYSEFGLLVEAKQKLHYSINLIHFGI
jgi:hypothetical protein